MLLVATIFTSPGVLDDFKFWRDLVGDMSAGLQGALIGTGSVLFLVSAGFIIERHWAVLRNIITLEESARFSGFCSSLVP